MRIMLVQSYLGRKEHAVLPAGLACIAAMLNSHEIRGYDPNISDNPYDEMKVWLNEFKPDIVCLSLRNVDTTQIGDLFLYYKQLKTQARLIKEETPNAKIIIGGPGFSLFSVELMKYVKEIDFGVYLEGEESLPELLKNLKNPEEVMGIYYRRNGEIIFTGDRPLPDLAALPEPKREIFDLSRYFKEKFSVGIFTKRGCKLKCAYCCYPHLNGINIRFRPPERIVDELENLANLGMENFTFGDSVFNIPQNHAEEICRAMIKRKLNLKWTAWFNEKNITKEFLLLAVEAGCIAATFSSDAFSANTLKALRKNINVLDIKKGYKLTKEVPQLKVGYNFFVNPPEQTFFSFCSLVLFFLCVNVFSRKQCSGFSLGNIRIEPHTAIYDMALKEDIIHKSTSLFPRDEKELKKLFYINPRTKYLEVFLYVFNLLKRLKRYIFKGFAM